MNFKKCLFIIAASAIVFGLTSAVASDMEDNRAPLYAGTCSFSAAASDKKDNKGEFAAVVICGRYSSVYRENISKPIAEAVSVAKPTAECKVYATRGIWSSEKIVCE